MRPRPRRVSLRESGSTLLHPTPLTKRSPVEDHCEGSVLKIVVGATCEVEHKNFFRDFDKHHRRNLAVRLTSGLSATPFEWAGLWKLAGPPRFQRGMGGHPAEAQGPNG
jgi:hypothetical protein